jgi:hypothetical protein
MRRLVSGSGPAHVSGPDRPPPSVDPGRGRPPLRLGKVDEPVELNSSHRFLLLAIGLGRTPAALRRAVSFLVTGERDGRRMIPRVINRLKPSARGRARTADLSCPRRG